MIRRRYLVSGRVQGVGFRAFVVRRATAAGVTGWVRNRRDGRVEVLADATPEAHVALLEALETGPMWGKVTGVETADEEPAGGAPAGFTVRPTE